MRAALFAFALGVGLLQQQAALPAWASGGACLSLLALAAAAVLVAARRSNLLLRAALLSMAAIGAAALGFTMAAWRAETRLADALPRAWEGRDVQLAGVIDDLPQPGGDGSLRFAFAVEKIETEAATVPARLSLAWYPLRRQGEILAPPELHAGERWALTVRLRRMHGNLNPHGFDFEAWALERNLRAGGYVRVDPGNRRLDEFAGRPTDHVERLRETYRSRILSVLGEAPYAGTIVALAIGDQRAIPAAQWQTFNRSGIGHLISISGLHVTLFAALVGGLVFFLWRRAHWLTLRLPAHHAAALVGLLASAFYVLLAGFQVPAQRTLYMLAVAALGLLLARPGTAGVVLLWALAAVLAIDPWAVLAPGFWLSFSAVALLFYVSIHRTAGLNWLATAVSAQWAMTLGLLPLLLLFFQQVSLLSPLANAVAIPVVSFVVVPLTLLYLVFPIDALLHAAHSVFALLAGGLEFLAGGPQAVWQQHAPPLWAAALGLAGTLVLLAPRGVPARWLGAIWLAPAFLMGPERPPAGEVWVSALDVGQGTAVVVKTAQHSLLYDTGARFSPNSDAGNRIIAPYLRASGAPRLGGLVVSHQDTDHSGGALSLLQTVPADWLLSSLAKEHEISLAAAEAGLAQHRCEAGQKWEWDGVRFVVLHPLAGAYANPKLKANDLSCVIRIEDRHGSLLLAGDIEAKSEQELLRRGPQALASTVLLAPHHGSKTSSTAAFLDAVSPRLALFTVGYRNRHGHPKPEVAERYRERGIALWRTDQEGAIRLRFSADGPKAEGFRSQERRYWREAPLREEIEVE